MTCVIDLIDYGLNQQPDRECLRDAHLSLSHRQVASHSHRIAHAIRAAGLEKGARVGFFTVNCVQAMTAMISVFRSGAVWLPVHPRNLVDENVSFLTENECELLFFHSKTAAQAEQFRKRVPSIKALICLDQRHELGPYLLDWAADQPQHFLEAQITPEDVVWVKGTGGTTGAPKSVLVTNKCAVALFATFNWCLPLTSGHITLAAAPISHGAGTYALCALCSGGTIVLIEKADPVTILYAIKAYQITTLFLPPTVIYAMLALPDVRSTQYPSLKYLIYSAAPMSPDRLSEAIEIFGPVLTQIYGQTEAPAMLSVLTPADHFTPQGELHFPRLKSCGRPTPFVQLDIMDDEGNLLPIGEVGEIVVRGTLRMKGYRDDPEETAKVSQFGWHHTGDLGKKDEDGFFYIVDRKKNMIISGGFNIFPAEIEQILLKHSSVLDCAVVGAPDDKWGEAVTAVVELKVGETIDIAELETLCRQALGGLKTPKHFEIWSQLPRSAVGKVLHKKVREHFWFGRDRQL